MSWQSHNIHAPRFIRCSELRAINSKKLETVPVILQVTFRAPYLCGLAEESFHRGGPHALTCLGDHAAGQQVYPRFAIRAQLQTANNIGNWLIAEEGHDHHHPDNYVPPVNDSGERPHEQKASGSAVFTRRAGVLQTVVQRPEA
ncbi:hypothetical protein G806_05053 [Escherichia coli HVH 148 (4-3192490)]|uniref:Uncharacterized protein n=1 Tax=Klebsiella pneumoniae subsp. pneumoniae TaxID=72407 RepID=A0A8E6L6W0_KLEPN|nr:hypothetical protein G806_05053 [Escherichia coli HVH 148 (4-3192490)]QVQ58875.1 hypothetical protein OPNDJPPI_00015 [Klebsiella pneumoniae subsp. pneumoniae]WKW90366.1 hypothetical protein BOMOAG_00075 [Klebsiella pneumoniae]WKW90595.1 hypothetical protein MDMHKJ_00060 [Klebsiella pneumoniae]